MLTRHAAEDRGHFDHGWLDTFHTFSFGGYQDPRRMGFRSLRVINEDRVAPGEGFGRHRHQNMEILSYVLSGSLQHRDSLGHGGVLGAGEFQRITAGSGIAHSEFNASRTEPVHFYQIWIYPDRQDLPPSYEQGRFADEELRGRLRVVASADGREASLKIHQDAQVLLGRLEAGDRVEYPITRGRHAWVQVTRGELEAEGQLLATGDGAAISQTERVEIVAKADSEILLFDLA